MKKKLTQILFNPYAGALCNDNKMWPIDKSLKSHQQYFAGWLECYRHLNIDTFAQRLIH